MLLVAPVFSCLTLTADPGVAGSALAGIVVGRGMALSLTRGTGAAGAAGRAGSSVGAGGVASVAVSGAG